MSSELKTRIFTATVLVISLVLTSTVSEAFHVRPEVFAVIGIAVLLGLGHESANILERYLPRKIASSLSIAAMLPTIISNLIFLYTGSFPIFIYPVLLIIAVLFTFFGKDDQQLFKDIAFSLPALLFPVFLGGLSLTYLATLQTFSPLIWVIIVVVFSDSAAYFIGKKFGTKYISNYLSPKKTVEGIYAHFLTGTFIGSVAGYLLFHEFYTYALLGLLTAISAQTFDLLKSSIKREANVKDSGTIFPGHGGLLDRLDGILGGAVVMVAYLFL